MRYLNEFLKTVIIASLLCLTTPALATTYSIYDIGPDCGGVQFDLGDNTLKIKQEGLDAIFKLKRETMKPHNATHYHTMLEKLQQIIQDLNVNPEGKPQTLCSVSYKTEQQGANEHLAIIPHATTVMSGEEISFRYYLNDSTNSVFAVDYAEEEISCSYIPAPSFDIKACDRNSINVEPEPLAMLLNLPSLAQEEIELEDANAVQKIKMEIKLHEDFKELTGLTTNELLDFLNSQGSYKEYSIAELEKNLAQAKESEAALNNDITATETKIGLLKSQQTSNEAQLAQLLKELNDANLELTSTHANNDKLLNSTIETYEALKSTYTDYVEVKEDISTLSEILNKTSKKAKKAKKAIKDGLTKTFNLLVKTLKYISKQVEKI